MQKKLACEVYSVLFRKYLSDNSAVSFLCFDNPFQILILTILSAQTTDKTVNKIRKTLFNAYPTPLRLSRAQQTDVEKIIQSTGFYHTKAKNIIATASKLITDFDGDVPQTMAELTTLPGVGRKTANIVLNHAYGINEGIAVDTHVKRVSQRIGLTDSTAPEKIEADLMSLYPGKCWGNINYLFILHGRQVCHAKNPRCNDCPVRRYCRYFNLQK